MPTALAAPVEVGMIFSAAARLRRQFGQPKVQHFGLSALRNENVCGLDVAVNDSFGVRRFERIGNLRGQVKQRLGF